jgi:hypothetical protein
MPNNTEFALYFSVFQQHCKDRVQLNASSDSMKEEVVNTVITLMMAVLGNWHWKIMAWDSNGSSSSPPTLPLKFVHNDAQ